MKRTNLIFIAFAVLGLFHNIYTANALQASGNISISNNGKYEPGSRSSGTALTEEQKADIVKKLNEILSGGNGNEGLNRMVQQYHSGAESFKRTSYTYTYNKAEATRRAENLSLTAELSRLIIPPAVQVLGKAKVDAYIAEKKQEIINKKIPELMSKTQKEQYSSFINRIPEPLQWTKEELQTAGKNNVRLETGNRQNTGIKWENVISKAQKQATIENNPKAGAEKAISLAEDLDNLQMKILRDHGKAKALLAALNPANHITATCNVVVPKGETCPEGQLTYSVTTENGKATTGASKGCTPLPVKYAEIQACILCPLFDVILRTDQVMATKSYGALASSFRNLIIVVLALFIAYQTLITVSAFTKQDAPKYIGTLLTQGFKVFVAALLLSDSSYIYHYVINPLMQAGLEFGLALLFDGNLLQDFKTLTQVEAGGMAPGVISPQLLSSVMAAVKLFNKAAAQLPAIGSSLICISYHEAALIIDFSMFIEGLLIYAFGWAIALVSCFYLLDSVVRFGIFCALLPFLIASWPFKVTVSYAKTGWDIFMNAFFNFVTMGLIISINTELIGQALSGGRGGIDELEAAINGSEVETLKDLMDISGVEFLVLIACCLFAFKLVGQINELAGQISSTSGGTAIGSKIGGLAAQGVQRAAAMAAKGGKAIVGGGASAIAEGTGLKDLGERTKAKIGHGLGKVGAKVGLGSQANPNGAGGAGGGSGGAGGNSGGSGGGSGGDNNSGGEEDTATNSNNEDEE